MVYRRVLIKPKSLGLNEVFIFSLSDHAAVIPVNLVILTVLLKIRTSPILSSKFARICLAAAPITKVSTGALG